MPTPAELQAVIKTDLWPRQLQDLTETVRVAVHSVDPSLNPDRALLLSAAVVYAIADEYGGTRFYMKRAPEIKRAVRNSRICSEFDGTTEGPNGIRQLAYRYRTTEQTIYSILRHQRQLQRATSP